MKPLIETGLVKTYKRYSVDTELLAKEEYINYIFHKFNTFKYYLKFTVDRFEDNRMYFLHIATDKTDNHLYYTAHKKMFSVKERNHIY